MIILIITIVRTTSLHVVRENMLERVVTRNE